MPKKTAPLKIGATDRGLVVGDLREFLKEPGKEITVPRSLLEHALKLLEKTK